MILSFTLGPVFFKSIALLILLGVTIALFIKRHSYTSWRSLVFAMLILEGAVNAISLASLVMG